MAGMKWIVFSFFLFGQKVIGEEADNFGLIYAEDVSDPTNHAFYCMMYNPRFRRIPIQQGQAVKYKLINQTSSYLCEPPEVLPNYNGDAVAVKRGNCTFSEKARLVQKYQGEVAVIVSSYGVLEPNANSTSDYDEINITVAMVGASDFKEIMELGEKIVVQLFAPGAPHVDYNLILIWLMATGTVIAGALWSGHVKHQQMLRKIKRRRPGSRSDEDEREAADAEDEQETVDVSPKTVIVFVVLMCAMLVSLYYLYDYLVYVIIGLFSVASSAALYSCLKPLMLKCVCIGQCRIPPNKLPLLSSQPEVRRLVLGAFCLAIGIFWAIMRNQRYAWILQDSLGIVFCVHMMKTVRLPSFKSCTILLSLLFIYDIFFVFITPLFTKSGESVMVEVATGGSSSSGEMLPMVLKVPRFSNSVLSMCMLPYSLLGFGDILVPGLLVSYCYGFDLKVESGKVYFSATTIAYGFGLLVTFLALALMSSGQPALLYLVPCTVLTALAIGWKRGELRHLWQGELNISKASHNKNIGNAATVTSGGTPYPGSPPEGGTTSASDLNVEVSSDSGDEQRQLLINGPPR